MFFVSTRQHSDRFNFSFQRQLPTGMIVDVTYFLNYSNFSWDLSRDLNMVDPRISYQYKAATNVQVANPFYNILTVQKFPGPLRSQRTVGITSLMKPYPQYGSINRLRASVGDSIYHAFTLRAERSFEHGLMFQVSYTTAKLIDNVNERFLGGADLINPYDLRRSRSLSAADISRRLVANWVYELPFGRNKRFASHANGLVDRIEDRDKLTVSIGKVA